MMLTDLLLRDAPPAARRAFNALAEEPETVAAALAPRLRALAGAAGTPALEFLTPLGALLRVAARGGEMARGGRFFDAEGRRVAGGGARYQENGVREQLPESEGG
jgi:chlorophyll(ide) b reductase